MPRQTRSKTEIIAVCSGKGGTGKTLIASCLGYALIRAGLKVLMIDGDPATSGMSLFLLGPKGMRQAASFDSSNTFAGLLQEFQRNGTLDPKPRTIHRSGADDHGVAYDSIICTTSLYGETVTTDILAVPDLDQSSFRAAIRLLFDILRRSNDFDYVIVDTRGGFAFESTDICALADSFLLVTEPTISSFYQDRNLVQRINQASSQMSSSSILRAILVNKATDSGGRTSKNYLDDLEFSFRNELTKEFGIEYSVTHSIPADISALHAYKEQKIPYVSEPGSMFSYSTLFAFSDIVQVVTSKWSQNQVSQWNLLVDQVSAAVEISNKKAHAEEERNLVLQKELSELRAERLVVERQLASLKQDLDAREIARSNERDMHYRAEVMALAEAKVGRSRLWGTVATGLVAILLAGVIYVFMRREASVAQQSTQNAKDESSLKYTQAQLALLQDQLLQMKAARNESVAALSSIRSGSKASILSVVGNAKEGRFVIVLSDDLELEAKGPGAPSAAYEAQLAAQNGFVGVTMYKKGKYYETAVPFLTETAARTALPGLQAWNNGRWRGASIHTLDTWCLKPTDQGMIHPKGFDVPVMLCSLSDKQTAY